MSISIICLMFLLNPFWVFGGNPFMESDPLAFIFFEDDSGVRAPEPGLNGGPKGIYDPNAKGPIGSCVPAGPGPQGSSIPSGPGPQPSPKR